MEYIIISISVVLMFSFFSLIGKLSGFEDRLQHVEHTFDQIGKERKLLDDPINDELRLLLLEGKDVAAVKKVREAFGFSIMEAKKYIDNLNH
ncbi:hypothetical protein [Aquibacillus kalidii]|uniref:hypothetical protein n=1 Tax=Aquibacillus kalidii TaxID=2762597 RepID=UPI001648A1AB|nr:hypothetical protein [Aquibacillus kalidii]